VPINRSGQKGWNWNNSRVCPFQIAHCEYPGQAKHFECQKKNLRTQECFSAGSSLVCESSQNILQAGVAVLVKLARIFLVALILSNRFSLNVVSRVLSIGGHGAIGHGSLRRL